MHVRRYLTSIIVVGSTSALQYAAKIKAILSPAAKFGTTCGSTDQTFRPPTITRFTYERLVGGERNGIASSSRMKFSDLHASSPKMLFFCSTHPPLWLFFLITSPSYDDGHRHKSCAIQHLPLTMALFQSNVICKCCMR